MALFEHMSLGYSLMVSVFGIAVVFVALVAINTMIKGLAALVRYIEKRQGVSSVEAAPSVGASPSLGAARFVPAPGAMGEIDLYDVDDESAGMLMAIVADEIGAPLNTLRFISIKRKDA